MPSSVLADRFRRWFEYEKDSHAKTLASLDAATAAVKANPGYAGCIELVGHIAVARMFWLYRLGILPEAPSTFFPENQSLADVRGQIEEMHRLWDAYLATVDDAELARRFQYNAWEGPRFENSVEEVLTQLFGHSISHRGQLAKQLREIGGEAAATEYVFWSRVPAEN